MAHRTESAPPVPRSSSGHSVDLEAVAAEGHTCNGRLDNAALPVEEEVASIDFRGNRDKWFEGKLTMVGEGLSFVERPPQRETGSYAPNSGYNLHVPDDNDQRLDPFEQPTCCWWPRWVVTGSAKRQEEEFRVHPEHYETLAERFGWDLNGIDSADGVARRNELYQKIALKRLEMQPANASHYLKHHNVQALYHRLKIDKFLLWTVPAKNKWYTPIMNTLLLILCCSVPALVTCLLLFGAVPLGRPLSCQPADNWVYPAIVNPLAHTIHAFCDFTIGFACIDLALPWRPFRYYAPFLLLIYLVEVAAFLPLAVSGDSNASTFPMMGLVAFAIRFLFVFLAWLWMREWILYYDHETDTVIPAGPGRKRNERGEALFVVYRKVLLLQFFLSVTYIVVVYGFKAASKNGQTALGIATGIVGLIARKVIQHATIKVDVDLSFLMCGGWRYLMEIAFTAFAFVTVKDQDVSGASSVSTYFALAAPVAMDVFDLVLHQWHAWFRFRCWIRSWPKSLFKCLPLDPLQLPVLVDMDPDGRGCTNAWPDYRRGKVRFAYWAFFAGISGNMFYAVISPVLYYGQNNGYYPYNQETVANIYVNILQLLDGEGSFTEDHYVTSLIAAACLAALLFIGLISGWWYLHKYCPAQSEYGSTFHVQSLRKPWFLACVLLVCTQVLMTYVPLYNLQARVLYADITDICPLWDQLNDFLDVNTCDNDRACIVHGMMNIICDYNEEYANIPLCTTDSRKEFICLINPALAPCLL